MKVTLNYNDGIHSINTGSELLQTLKIDDSKNNEGLARKMLASSALYCYVATLVGVMDKKGIEFTGIDADAELIDGQDSKTFSHTLGIKITVTVHFEKEPDETFAIVRKGLEHGCLVTAALGKGVAMEYNLNTKVD